jgi:hypothetical protein
MRPGAQCLFIQVSQDMGKYRGNATRPATTATDTGWAWFWKVEGLKKLPEPIAIGKLRGYNPQKDYDDRFIP